MRMAALRDVERYLTEELPSSVRNAQTEGAGRRRAARLLGSLGDPQNDLRVIHVAGTAGKGSVSTFVSSILVAHGFRVGTYLSPHVQSVMERFQLDGRPASAADFADALVAVHDRERELRQDPLGAPTMFEVATAAAFQFFRDRKVDYAVVETGLGGLHDATNTVARADKLAVLTAIGLDHTAVLGETLPEIAAQKAGILPPGGAGIALRSVAAADQVVEFEAARRNCVLDLIDPDEAADLAPHVVLGLPGHHQRINAGLAVRVVRHLAERDRWRLEPRLAADGLRRVQLPGRFERRWWRGRQLVLDGAHNPLKLGAVVDTVRDEWPGRQPVWVLAIKPGKDIEKAVRVVAQCASGIVATEFSDGPGRGRAVAADVLAAAARRAGCRQVLTQPCLAQALKRAVELSDKDTPVVVTGSFFAVADTGGVIGS